MFEAIAVIVAFLMAVMVVAGIFIGAHWGHQRQHGLLPYIVYPMLLFYGLSTLLSGRDLTVADDVNMIALTKQSVVVWTGRLTSLFILFAAGERIVHRMLMRGTRPPLARGLVLSFWLYFLTNTASPALFGRNFYISHEFLYVLVAGLAALLITGRDEFELAVRSTRNGFLLFTLASLACVAVQPHLVMASNYHGLIPAVHLRFAGLSSHANTMGSLMVFFMLCLSHQPFRSRSLNLGSWLLAGLSLLLSQSKTSLVAAVLCACALFYFSRRDAIQRSLRDYKRPHLPVLFILAVMAGGTALCLVFMFGSAGERLARFLGTEDGANLIQFSGRQQIWEIAVQEWHQHPVFGYGLNIWDEAFRNSIGMPFAVHAHSQFYQALSSAGLVGVGGLLIYAASLCYFVLKTAQASKGMTLALFILLLCKSISEVPLAMTGLGPDLIHHLLLLAGLAAYYVPLARQARWAAAEPGWVGGG